MADNYAYFYNSKNGDRVYNADSMTDWLRPFFVTGVFNGEMQVTANDDMTVTVAGGYCNIGGKVKNFVRATIDLETASGTLDRIDTVILRRNDADRDIQILIQTGGYSSIPSPKPLVRDGAYYDLKLAEIYVAAGTVRITQAEITDTRADKDVCGWVCSTVKEIDFEQITTQFSAYFAQYQEKITEQFKTYVAFMTNLEQQGDTAFQSMLSTFFDYEETQETRFNNLYEEMRDLIGETAAAKLQDGINKANSRIDQTEEKINKTVKQSDVIKSLAITEEGKVMDGKTCADGINKAIGTTLTGTLAAGAKTLLFTDEAITDDCMIDIYTNNAKVTPSAATQSGNTLTLTFDAQTVAVGVKVRVM